MFASWLIHMKEKPILNGHDYLNRGPFEGHLSVSSKVLLAEVSLSVHLCAIEYSGGGRV